MNRTLTPLAIAVALTTTACRGPVGTRPAPALPPMRHDIVPVPSTIQVSPADSFLVTPRTVVYVDAGASPEVASVGDFAAAMIASQFGAHAQRLGGGAAPDSSIWLSIDSTRRDLGQEGYELTATRALL